MTLFGLFKKKKSSVETIDLTSIPSMKKKIQEQESATLATQASSDSQASSSEPAGFGFGSYDSLPSTTATTQTSTQPEYDSISSRLNALIQRVDLLEHKVDRLERKTGIKNSIEFAE